MKLTYLVQAATIAFGAVTTASAHDTGFERRHLGATPSDQDKALLAARQYHPHAARAEPAFVALRSRPSATICPIGSQRLRRHRSCVPCSSLGREDNTAVGQPCGGCIDVDQVIGRDHVCYTPPCDDPNATPLPSGGCGDCFDGFTLVEGGSSCVSCESLGVPDGVGGTCGTCESPFVVNPATRACSCPVDSQAQDSTCVACEALHREDLGAYGACGECKSNYTDIDSTCVLACTDPNATQSPQGGCGVCRTGFVNVDEEECVSCLSLGREDGAELGCGSCIAGEFVEIDNVCVARANIVQNPGFEVASQEEVAPEPWYTSANTGAAFATADVRHYGTMSYAFGSSQPFTICQTVHPVNTGSHTFSFWASTSETDSARSGGFTAEVRTGDITIFQTGELKDSIHTSDWVEFTFLVSISPAITTFDICFIVYNPPSWYFVDDIVFK